MYNIWVLLIISLAIVLLIYKTNDSSNSSSSSSDTLGTRRPISYTELMDKLNDNRWITQEIWGDTELNPNSTYFRG